MNFKIKKTYFLHVFIISSKNKKKSKTWDVKQKLSSFCCLKVSKHKKYWSKLSVKSFRKLVN